MAELYLGGMLMYYKIRISFDHTGDGCSWIEEYVQAESLKEAESLVSKIVKDYGITQKFETCIKESTIDKAIEKEKNTIWQRTCNQYILRAFDPDKITVKEYSKIQKELKDDKEKNYEMLKDISRYNGICEFVKKTVDTKKVSVFEFEQIVSDLYKAKTDVDFEKVYIERISNYKKEENLA